MAEVKDLENVEQEATAPAMEETAADSAAPAETRVNLKARWRSRGRSGAGSSACAYWHCCW